jgi:hypothetical protein
MATMPSPTSRSNWSGTGFPSTVGPRPGGCGSATPPTTPNEAEAIGPANTVRRIEHPPLPEPEALAALLDPLTFQLRRLAEEQLPAGTKLPTLYQLLPQVVDLVASMQHALNTAADPNGTGWHNLGAVESGATQVAATAARALAETPRGRP